MHGGLVEIVAGEVYRAQQVTHGLTFGPFVDVDDIADVAVAALTEDGHAGQVYELTGPRLLWSSQTGSNRNNLKPALWLC